MLRVLFFILLTCLSEEQIPVGPTRVVALLLSGDKRIGTLVEVTTYDWGHAELWSFQHRISLGLRSGRWTNTGWRSLADSGVRML
jgi:hypothetical protein